VGTQQGLGHAFRRIRLQALDLADVAHERERVERPIRQAAGSTGRERGGAWGDMSAEHLGKIAAGPERVLELGKACP